MVREAGKLPTVTGAETAVDGFILQAVSDKAREYIRANWDRPFFLNYWTSPPHIPIGPDKVAIRYDGMCRRDEALLRDNAYDQDGNSSRDDWRFKAHTTCDHSWRSSNRNGRVDSG
ncbi:MAG: hypothetical protein OXN96_20905 [Bryobacterales bacterium]|nr:hypothetical protein [Bryobacterales bacterium]